MNQKKHEFRPQIGEVYLMKFDGDDSEQKKMRPGIVFQNNIGNVHSPNIIALPLTGHLKKITQPPHVIVRASDTGLKCDSVALCENPVCMSKKKIGNYITTLPDKYMKQIAAASLLATSAIAYLDMDSLADVWGRAIRLNSSIPA